MPTEKWVTYLRDTFRMMWHVPIAFITGKTGKNVKALLNHGQMLFNKRERVSTADLNKVVRAAIEGIRRRWPTIAAPRSITARRSACSRRRSYCSAMIRKAIQDTIPAVPVGRISRSPAVCRGADQALPCRSDEGSGLGNLGNTADEEFDATTAQEE